MEKIKELTGETVPNTSAAVGKATPKTKKQAFIKQVDISALNTVDKLDERLGEIYEQLSVINASAAEAKARRILFGLGP